LPEALYSPSPDKAVPPDRGPVARLRERVSPLVDRGGWPPGVSRAFGRHDHESKSPQVRAHRACHCGRKEDTCERLRRECSEAY